MEDIWVKDDEKVKKKGFLTVIVLLFTLLLGSTGLRGSHVYYLSFLAASLTYYLLLDRKRVDGVIVSIIAVFVSGTFVAYIGSLFIGSKLHTVIDFKPLLLGIIFIITTVGLIPENVLSELRERVRQ
ncbi:MAG: hypothetical protein ABEK04_02310 [Candidatus Nanohalobium sp.]